VLGCILSCKVAEGTVVNKGNPVSSGRFISDTFFPDHIAVEFGGLSEDTKSVQDCKSKGLTYCLSDKKSINTPEKL
jgi:hypothetical protein